MKRRQLRGIATLWLPNVLGFNYVITRPVMHQPTNSTLQQPPLDSATQISCQICGYFGNLWTFTGILVISSLRMHRSGYFSSFWSKFIAI